MRARNLIPYPSIAAYVDRILVLEYEHLLQPFVLSLYANGVPYLLFTTVKGTLGKDKSTHISLFGQTICPQSLVLTEGFTLTA